MFSLSKILVLAAIIALVWYGFKWVSRVNKIRAEKEIDAAKGTGMEDLPVIEDMAKCTVCGTFVPATGAADCGRGNCPYSD
jgi:uncharacterized protein